LISLPGDTPLAVTVDSVDNTETMHTQMPAPRQVFFCFVFFVATKKMKLLSGNPDVFALVFLGSSTQRSSDYRPISLKLEKTEE
jgi:hypothetical protein